MPTLTFKNSVKNILIIGPIYDNLEKLESAFELSKHYDLTIFNGNLCYPFNDQTNIRIQKMNDMLKHNNIIYNVGNLDYLIGKNESSINDWIKDKPNIIIIEFFRGSNLIITNGGITPSMKKNDLFDNIEPTFVDNIDQKSWHEIYNGRMGYIVSNNPLSEKDPHFFNYSANIGIIYKPNVEIYAQEANPDGLGKTFLL